MAVRVMSSLNITDRQVAAVTSVIVTLAQTELRLYHALESQPH